MFNNKIPTLAAIFLITIGLFAGVILIDRRQIFYTEAQTGTEPKDLRFSNITDRSITISWITDKESRSFVSWGSNPDSLTRTAAESLDQANFIHYVTINELTPEKEYFFVINTNHQTYNNNGIPWKVKTFPALTSSQEITTITGSIATKTGIAVKKAIVYVVVSGGSLLSTTTSDKGSWVLDISKSKDLTGKKYLAIDNSSTIEVTVQAAPLGMASAISYPENSKPLPPIYIGESYNFENTQFKEEGSVSIDSLDLPTGTTIMTFPASEDAYKTNKMTNFAERLTTPLVLSIISVSAIILCVIVFYLSLYQENFAKNKMSYAHR